MSRPAVYTEHVVTLTTPYTATTSYVVNLDNSCSITSSDLTAFVEHVILSYQEVQSTSGSINWGSGSGYIGRYEPEAAGIAGMSQAGAQENSENIKAARKAWDLLSHFVTDHQWRTLVNQGWFDVEAPDDFVYRLLYRRHGNVLRLNDDGEIAKAWCGHLGVELPIADNLLGQMLLLANDPPAYYKNANMVYPSEFRFCVPMGGFKERLREIFPDRYKSSTQN